MVEVASMVDVAMVVGGMAAGATTEVGTVMDAGEAVVIAKAALVEEEMV